MSGADRELDQEIESHLAEATEEYIARGLSPEEARYAALRDFGGVTQVKQVHREMNLGRFAVINWLDLKLGGRLLMKYPGLTIVGGLAMTFAIWAGLVIFQMLSIFVHPTVPLPKAARLVELHAMDVAANEDEDRILHDFLAWRQSLRSVTDIGAWRNSNRNLIVSPGGDVRPVLVAEMSVSGFRVSDGEPLLGRVLVEADEQPSAPPVVVIGYDVWRTRFDGDPDVLGRTVQLGDEHPTVVGVMREGYEFPVSHDVWLPLKTAGLAQQPRSGPSIVVFGLLAPGATLQTAQAELTAAGRRIAAQFPDTHQHLEPFVRPYAMMASPAGEPSGQMILYSVYFFTGLLLLLICGNVGLLLFARAASREADLVVRTALGASRGRIVGQMFAEALVLGSLAAIAGVAAADVTLRNWGIVFLETNLGELPFWFDLSLSPQAFLVAIVLTVACAAVAGIMPALKITRGMGDRLKQTTAGAGGLQFGGVWTVVIVAQVAATVMFPAIVYLEQSLLSGVREFDAGFPTGQYLAVKIERDYPVEADPDADAALFERNARLMVTLDELRQRVTAQPGVAGVTFSEDIPTTNRPNKAVDMGYDVDAASAVGGANTQALFRSATIAPVDPSYFGVLEPQILAGRTFTAADALPGARVAIVDQGFVDQVLQGRNAVGQQVRFRYGGPAAHPWSPVNGNDPEVRPGDWYEVIGVVPDLGVGAPTQKGRAAGLYIPVTPDRFDQIFMIVRARGGDPLALVPQLRDAAAAVDPSMRLINVKRVNEANDDVLWVMGMWLRITVMLSAVAIVLSLAGIFAVLSFTVARRTREIGVRVALGANRRRVIFATFRRPLFQVTLGICIGTAIIFGGAFLFRTTELPGSESELTLQGMAMIAAYGIVMLGVCMLACVVPTRRALTIEPTTALRTE